MSLWEKWREFTIQAELSRLEVNPQNEDKLAKHTWEGTKRAGRISLYPVFLPVGIWRSVRHAKRKHEDRLAAKIAKELRNND